MNTVSHNYRGFHVTLRPDPVHPEVRILSRDDDMGVCFTPRWGALAPVASETKQWLQGYAAGLIDCELAGGFGILLRQERGNCVAAA
ncbi:MULTISPECIES: hypothetical protein [unclassified Cupriavidus]|uniref:hypothetical protein n=1 Tax=unclassified Cupriavidus TaxID=2640874 RepID=UPI001BFFEE41|nr:MULTISPECIES: hypothetical protein [unclassified Cupriavidus]MCA3183701.1 hypothetical protein [Cupriavidus sp.]MCA3194113.1 hypothetical protein [Cupriavidus sp.]MCA3199246.1 hypothetical protein [Cupriavidus sp.]MCA3209690.1 hypothetical protein [Cupriavidus sp.]MCA3233202.1 hypothetical protein [Cupriavidus sp.]